MTKINKGKNINNLDRNNASKEYWENKLLSDVSQTRVRYDFQGNKDYQIQRQSFSVSEKSNETLFKMTKNKDMLIYSFLVSIFSIEISRYISQEDVIVGIPMYGDYNEEKSRNYDSVLPLITNINNETIVKDHIKNIHSSILEVYKNQFYSVSRIMKLMDIDEGLTNICVMYEEIHDKKLIDKVVNSKEYDITIVLKKDNNEITLDINYNPEGYRESTIEGLGQHFNVLLDNGFENINSKINEIEMLSSEEKHKLLFGFNDTASDYPRDKTIQELFEEQVERNPDKVALVFEGKEMTYKELNERSNQVAKVLRGKGVKADSKVGIMVERSLEMIVGMIGILKAGGAYLPIDPSYPKDRIEYMLEDSQSKILLSHKNLVDSISFGGEFIDLFNKKLYQGDSNNIDKINNSRDLAYVIYTSGTTGKPKGVMISHYNLVNYCSSIIAKLDLTVSDEAALLSSYAFDLGYTNIFTSLLIGGKLNIITDEKYKNPKELVRFLMEDITYIKITPSIFNMIINSGYAKQLFDNSQLRVIVMGGESININDLRKFVSMSTKKNIDIVNHYGPTESTIGCIATFVDLENLDYFRNIIGSPINNIKAFIVNKENNLCGVNIAGELCISGEGVTRGYLNRPELTAEKFIENPFESDKKMYRTGDLARWLPDGNIEFLGRIDNQVKIRGFRIELGEIENKILQHEEIKETTVLVKENQENEKYICAYVVSEKDSKDLNLKDYLKISLPDYMIPSYFIQMEKMPVTANGKLNRKALPEPNINEILNEYKAPRNEVEERLVEIFKEVLNLESKIGIRDSFFDLGGHSLKATILVSRIHREFDVEIPLMEVFKLSTVEKLAKAIETLDESIYKGIEPVEDREYYPMSSAQRRMYIINQMDTNLTTYNMPSAKILKGELDVSKVEDIFRKLISRHEALRTSFTTVEDELVQKVSNISKVEFKVDYEDISKLNLELDEQEDIIKGKVENFVRSFDLEKGTLIRVGVIKLGENKYLLMVDMHHIISDGVSGGLVIEEFMKLYKGEELEPLNIQYKDYAIWQNKLFESDDIKEQEKYWLEKFEGEIPVLDIKTDYKRPAIQSYEGASKEFVINQELTKELRNISDETGTTLYMVLLSAINVLLQKYTGQEDIVVGSAIAGRPHNDLSNIVGMFVNALAMRNQPKGSMKFREFLEEVKENSLKAYSNQDIQFEELVEKLNIERDMSRNPLFDIMFVLQNTGTYEKDLSLEGLKISDYDLNNGIAKFDMTITAIELNDKISLTFNYATKLYKESTIERMVQHFNRIIEGVSKDRDIEIQDIDILSEQEKHKLLVDFNDTKVDYPKDKTIQELFEEQVQKNPEKVALVFDGEEITYRELNNRSNQVARKLRKMGVKPDEAVGMMVERSFETIISIIAILKAGGGYVPIDPSYPKDRINYMLEDTNIRVILTADKSLDKLKKKHSEVELLNVEDKTIFSGDESNLDIINKSSNLAYIIYTSGSTGKPKGVMVKHRNVIRLVKGQSFIDYSEDFKMLQAAPISFDASTLEVWGAILNGMELHLINESDLLDIDKFGSVLENKDIDILWLTSALFSQFAGEKPEIFKGLKYLLSGGDVLSRKHINIVKEKCPNVTLINGYGPTESTTFATTFTIDKLYQQDIPIGKPINNTQVYVLNNENKLQPIGVAGELCISGDGLARGYLNKPTLTEEKFVDNPYLDGEKMYRTGDLVRWTENGNIEFIGRIDNQVKIRGFRIELGEIENQILKLSQIKETVVTVVGEDREKAICAYLVKSNESLEESLDKSLDILDIRDNLSNSLPDYMMPSYFIELESIPVTLNGKVDRKSLPKPDESLIGTIEYIAPRNQVEEKLTNIFKEVLNIEGKIGIKANFFELGGHSLKATTLASKIHRDFGVKIPLVDIFKCSTVEKLAEVIQNSETSIYDSIEPVEKREYYPMSSAQKRMYIINQIDEETTTYNMPAILRLTGEVDKAKLENVFKKLVERHESLRTSFTKVEEKLVQRVKGISEIEFEMNFQDISQELSAMENEKREEVLTEKVKEFIRPFDLENGELFRVKIIKTLENEYLLLVDMHHIISDGVSMGIVIDEFTKLYTGEELQPLNIQYKDYAVWQNELFESGEIKEQEKYWLEKFEGEVPVLDLKTDYKRSAVQSYEGASKDLVINEELTRELKNIANETGATLYMVLLSAINVLLQKYTGQDDIVIGSPIAGRPHNDLSNIVGMFVNTLAMRNYPKGSIKFSEFLREVKVNSLEAYDNQDVQFEELVEKLDIERDMSRNPLFDIMFVLQNTGVNEKNLSLEGIQISDYDLNSQIAKFDMTITAIESDDEILLNFNYATKLYKEGTIERMVQHFNRIIEEISKDRDIEIQDIDILSEKEKHKLLFDFNDTKADYPKNKTIQELFEEQVERNPEKIALVFEGEEMTYRELNNRSNQVAKKLRKRGVKKDDFVAILVDPSFEMVIGLMGVLKSGGAYLPIDPNYPQDRIAYVLENSSAKILLTQTKYVDELDNSYNINEVLDLQSHELDKVDKNNLKVVNTPNDLAYVIYTSGSTGRPKGVMIEHNSAINLCQWHIEQFEVTSDYNVSKYANFGFDASVWELLPNLLAGASIYIIGENLIYDVKNLNKYLEENKVKLSFLPTQVCEELMKEDNKELKFLLTGGDKLKSYTKQNYRLFNNYGPTENTVVTTSYEVVKEEDNIPIGKPIMNSKVYILNEYSQLQPIGVPGELCISGEGVARGYLNNKELTEEKFVDNPFVDGEKMYRTGDLVRWLENGNIEFLGRIDSQVKIRGFRIELGEIENQILKLPQIKETVVTVVGEDKEKAICAYLVKARESLDESLDQSLDISKVKYSLSKVLPDYMIPSYYIEIDEIPVTLNGKVDRKALPKPEESLISTIEYIAPRNEREERLINIFKEVLNIDGEIGIKGNFFELGGHSLKATTLASKIHREFGVKIPLMDIFKSSTVEKLAEVIQTLESSIYDGIKPVEKREYYPMSSAQRRMYIINQMDKETTTYNMPFILELKGTLDKERLESTFVELIKRHETLRTNFTTIEDELVQKIREISEVEFQMNYEDISRLDIQEEEQERLLQEKVKAFIKPFNLKNDLLIRVNLIEVEESKSILMVDLHHIISDGVSMALIIEEFGKIYSGQEIEPLNIQYNDYAVWQNELFESGEIKSQEKYWLEKFEGEIPVLDLKTDYKRPAVQSYEGASMDFVINEEVTNGLKNIANKTGSTLYMVLLSAMNILLQKHTGQEDIIIGSPIAGRHHNDLSNIVGMFINTLAMRNQPKSSMKFSDFLAQVKENSLKAYDNQDIQFEDLVEKLDIERDMSRNPLFDVMFILQNTGIENTALELDGLEISPYESENKVAKFDITVTATENDKKISLEFNYGTRLYEKDTIARLGQHFTRILEDIVQNIDIEIKDIDVLSEKEKEEILVEFNNTDAKYPQDKTIHEIFEEQVEKNPDKVALVFEDKEMTYRELNKQSNILARKLRESGVKPNDLVAIMLDRSFEMIIGIMGILKSGGGYIPIDPSYPEDRIEYMLKDSKAKLLITKANIEIKGIDEETLNQSQKSILKGVDFDMEIINLDSKRINLEDAKSITEVKKDSSIELKESRKNAITIDDSNLETINKSNDLAYIIYTSGSTGKPKGVMIEHKSVINTLYSLNDSYPVEENDSYLLKTAFTFDVSVTELFTWFIGKGKLVILEQGGEKDPNAIYDRIQANNVTHINFAPTILNMFVNVVDVNNLVKLENLKYVMVAGEAFSKELAVKCEDTFGKLENIHIENIYGPTEATIYATKFSIANLGDKVDVPIGKPIDNVKTYVLDANNNIVPIGVTGELCIAGKGLARGYLNRPELTEEKFVTNPFNTEEKMYRSGDLVRWLPDGNIEFLGRIDHQVKIRGYRIELGEIESQLSRYKDIKEVVVIAKTDDDGNKYLCGYIVGNKKDKELNVWGIREHLSKELPEYMIPQYFVELEEMPLNTSGKVNRKALPEPDEFIKSVEYVAPRNEVEKKLVNIFKDILKLDTEIGIKDSFFEIGGHSLSATKLVSRIHKGFDVEIPLMKVFKSPTVERLAELIQTLDKSIYSEIKPVEKREYYPMSSAQKRMYIINQMDKNTTTYNMPTVLKLTGELDRERLENTFRELVRRHESLRTSFEMSGQEFIQRILDESEVEFKLNYEDISSMELEGEDSKELLKKKVKDFVKLFDLEGGCLFRVGLIKVSEGEHLLMVDMHHIISDGTSMGIIIEEFTKLYGGEELELLNLQYKDYAIWQNDLFKSGNIEEQQKYWLEKFEGEIPVLDLMTDYKRPSIQSYEGSSTDIVIDEKLTNELKSIVNKTGTTLYMVLLSALNVVLQKHTGQKDIIIGSPIAGRPHNDLSNIVGMFINTLAMRNKPEASKKFSEFLGEVKENSLKAYDNQDVQFEDLVEKLHIERDTSRNPLFDIMFVMQNTDINNNLSLDGLEIFDFDLENEIAKFDMTITAMEMDGAIKLNFNYASKLYKESTIRRLSKHFIKVLEEATRDIDLRLQDIDILSQEEKEKLIVEFNDMAMDYPKDKTIQEVFEEQVDKHPDKVALVFEDKEMTYKELNERSNQIARLLNEKGVKPNELVGIMVDRSFEMIVAIMGILKSGGAYLPIDPSYPRERIEYMLNDSEGRILLTQDDYMNEDYTDVYKINLNNEEIYQGDSSNLKIDRTSSSMAYAIYTSGSTGKPKGVMIEDHSLINFVWSMNKSFRKPLSHNDVVLALTNYAFDVSVCEIFMTILNGASMYIMKREDVFDPKMIGETIVKYNINFGYIPPMLLNAVLENLKDMKANIEEDGDKGITLNKLLVGVESINFETLYRYQRLNPKIDILNGYGPTEATICSTFYSVDYEGGKTGQVPIGKPVHNYQVFILGKENILQPIGVAGELCVSGDGLARGYLNREELTKEKFVENPFIPSKKMYRTGDLARWTEEGNIEFIGRADNQVKIRGFRVELGEIKNQLQNIDSIKEAVVTIVGDENSDKAICAYVVNDTELDVSEIREELLESLPDYMIPAYFVAIDEVPLTSNGKINKKVLPDYREHSIRATEYVSASNNIEEELVEIWQKALGIKDIGIQDNFFEIGGHSIKAMEIINSINDKLDVEISLMELYKRPNIKELSKFIENKDGKSYKKITKVPESDYYKPSYNQKRLWLVNQLESESSAYNMVMKETLNHEVNIEKLRNAFNNLANRHESLRTGIKTIKGEPFQFISDEIEVPLEIVDISNESKKEKLRLENYNKEKSYIFNIQEAPLFHVVLLKINDEEYDLIMNIHHIISDGYSVEIMKKEFYHYYEKESDTDALEPLEIQYKDFALWQNNFIENEDVKNEYKKLWLEKVGREVPKLNLPTINQDYSGDEGFFDKSSSTYIHFINEEIYSKLSEIAKENNTTLFMVMFSIYNMVLAGVTNQQDITCLLPNAGRENSHLQKLIGFFVNSVIVKNEVDNDEKYTDFLERVNEDTLKFFEYQSYPLEILVEELDIPYPRASVFFNMINIDDSLRDTEIESFEPVHIEEANEAKCEIAMYVTERKNGIVLNVNYWNRLFTTETIAHILSEYEKMLLFFSSNPESSYSDYKKTKKKKRRVRKRR